MTKNYLKNAFLIGSGVCLATSFAIYAQPVQLGTSIQANLVNLVQYLGELHITSDGTPNGNEVLSIYNDGEFSQSRGIAKLVNTANGPYPFVGATVASGNINIIGGVLGEAVATLAYQDVSGSGHSSYFMAQPDRAMLGFNSDLSNQTDTVNEVQVLDYGVVFRFPQASYTFPITIGTSGQVLATDGVNQLSWVDAGGSTEVVLTTHKTISSAEMLDLANNPITLIDAPSTNQFLDIISMNIRLSGVSVPYNFSGMPNAGMLFKFSTASNAIFTPATIFSNVSSDSFTRPTGAGVASTNSVVPEDPFVLTAGANPTQGDGTLDVYISYRIVDL